MHEHVADANTDEVLINETGDVLPDYAKWGYDSNTTTLDPTYGNPAPEIALYGTQAKLQYRELVPFDRQSVSMSIDVAAVFFESGSNTNNSKVAVDVGLFSGSAVTQPWVRYKVGYNVSDNVPVAGQPAGKWVILECPQPAQTAERKTAGLSLPFDHEALHRVWLVVDASGMRAGIDEVELCHEEAVTTLADSYWFWVLTTQEIRGANEIVAVDNIRLARGMR